MKRLDDGSDFVLDALVKAAGTDNATIPPSSMLRLRRQSRSRSPNLDPSTEPAAIPTICRAWVRSRKNLAANKECMIVLALPFGF